MTSGSVQMGDWNWISTPSPLNRLRNREIAIRNLLWWSIRITDRGNITYECWPSSYAHDRSCWPPPSRTGNSICFPYLGCCWLTDDHPSWTLLVTVMWDRDVGSPLIEEAFGSVNATVFDAGHLLKFLTYSITIVEIAPAGFICQEKPKRNQKMATCPWPSCSDLVTPAVVHLLVQITGEWKHRSFLASSRALLRKSVFSQFCYWAKPSKRFSMRRFFCLFLSISI